MPAALRVFQLARPALSLMVPSARLLKRTDRAGSVVRAAPAVRLVLPAVHREFNRRCFSRWFGREPDSPAIARAGGGVSSAGASTGANALVPAWCALIPRRAKWRHEFDRRCFQLVRAW